MCLAQGPQRIDAGEARTRGPSVSSQALYNWAAALPEYSMIVKLLTEHFFEFLSLKEGCRGSSESTLVKLLEISCRRSNIIQLLGHCIATWYPMYWSL